MDLTLQAIGETKEGYTNGCSDLPGFKKWLLNYF